MIITNRAKRIGRAVVASRYQSERERTAYLAGKYDDTSAVACAIAAAQFTMDELLPCLQICEIALDAGNTAIMKVNASTIKKAMNNE